MCFIGLKCRSQNFPKCADHISLGLKWEIYANLSQALSGSVGNDFQTRETFITICELNKSYMETLNLTWEHSCYFEQNIEKWESGPINLSKTDG